MFKTEKSLFLWKELRSQELSIGFGARPRLGPAGLSVRQLWAVSQPLLPRELGHSTRVGLVVLLGRGASCREGMLYTLCFQ